MSNDITHIALQEDFLIFIHGTPQEYFLAFAQGAPNASKIALFQGALKGTFKFEVQQGMKKEGLSI